MQTEIQKGMFPGRGATQIQVGHFPRDSGNKTRSRSKQRRKIKKMSNQFPEGLPRYRADMGDITRSVNNIGRFEQNSNVTYPTRPDNLFLNFFPSKSLSSILS